MPSLHSRVSRLEGETPSESYGAVIRMAAGACREAAKTEHVFKHGDYEGDTLFIEIVGFGADNG